MLNNTFNDEMYQDEQLVLNFTTVVTQTDEEVIKAEHELEETRKAKAEAKELERLQFELVEKQKLQALEEKKHKAELAKKEQFALVARMKHEQEMQK